MEFTMIETGWLSILPPIIAIALALITKEVYSSLFIGIVSGMLIYAFSAGGNIFSAAAMTFDMMSSKISDNAYMIIFLALPWAVVSLVSKSGEKLAYIIDATAAPVCIIAPVSSWAVAVASEVSEKNGFNIFLSTIPYNFYALMTILMVFFISFTDRDFGPMKKAEEAAAKLAVREEKSDSAAAEHKGRVIDLVLPIAVLIVCAILGMAYVGGFFEGVSFSEAIGYNPTAGLSLGAFAGLMCAMLLYLPRKLMKPKEFIECIVSGISNIVPPMLILILSWSLGGVCRQLIGTGIFISGFVNGSNLPLGFLPVLIFVICDTEAGAALLVPALGATLAGSVYGDHCSPISDTTILASTGADCVHIKHVETQLPYATLVAVVCAVGYLIAGFMKTPVVAIIAEAVLLIAAIMVLSNKKES